jgi:hypothetical protein
MCARSSSASGLGRRLVRLKDGSLRLEGLAVLLGIPDIVTQDIPANHLQHAECVITVDRRPWKQ